VVLSVSLLFFVDVRKFACIKSRVIAFISTNQMKPVVDATVLSFGTSFFSSSLCLQCAFAYLPHRFGRELAGALNHLWILNEVPTRLIKALTLRVQK
jgi:hypothetical protein